MSDLTGPYTRKQMIERLPDDGRPCVVWWLDDHTGDAFPFCATMRLVNGHQLEATTGAGYKPFAISHPETIRTVESYFMVLESIPPEPKPDCPVNLAHMLLAADDRWQCVTVDIYGVSYLWTTDDLVPQKTVWGGAPQHGLPITFAQSVEGWQRMKWNREDAEKVVTLGREGGQG